MADATAAGAVELFGGAVTLVPGGVTVRDPAKLRSPATDRLVWQAVFGGGDGAGGGALAALGAGPGTGARPGVDQRPLPGPRARASRRLHGAGDQRADAGLRHGARDLPRGARRGEAGAIILEIARSEIAYTDQRPAEYVAVMHRRRAARGLRPPAVHPGRPLPGERQEVRGRPRGRGGRGEEADRRGDRRRASTTSTWTPRRWWISPSRRSTSSSALNYERARRDHRLHPRAGARGRHGLGRRRDRRGGHEEQHGRGAARLHERLQPHARRGWACTRGSARSRCRPAPRTAGWCCPTARSPTVKLDLEALAALSKAAREEYGMAGAVQHGASTLPANAFGNFPRIETARNPPRHQLPEHRVRPPEAAGRAARADVRLARRERRRASGRPATPTSSSTTRRGRRRSGRSSRRCGRCRRVRGAIAADLERTFGFLFEQLNVNGTATLVPNFSMRPPVPCLAAARAGYRGG